MSSTTGQIRIVALFGGAVYFGQERGNVEALSALKDAGCEIVCLVRDDTWNTRIPAELAARGLTCIKVPYINNVAAGSRARLVAKNLLALVPAGLKFLHVLRTFKPTHIHAFNPVYVLNFLVPLLFLKAPMVYRAGDEPAQHSLFWRTLWRITVWRASSFAANTKYLADMLEASGVPRKKIVVIYNKPPRRHSASLPAEHFAGMRGTRYITFIGQIGSQKGPHLLIDAFREIADAFPNAHLLLAGRISEDWAGDAWARDLRARVRSDPVLCARATFLGEIDFVPALLELSEVLVTPSVSDDPSPNVVMEAKLSSRPSIVFPTGGLPELVTHETDGLVCASPTVEALVDALRKYLENPELAVKHGLAAHASLKHFRIDDFRDQWMDVYLRTGAQERRMTAGPGDRLPDELASREP